MRTRAQEGFTLIEILIVVTIIGLLMTFTATRLFMNVGPAKRTIAEGMLQKIAGALEVYRAQNGVYPSSEQGLSALVRKPTIAPIPRSYPPGGYLSGKDLLDPWGNAYRYTSPGPNNGLGFDLLSLGPDGQEGGEGDSADIANYELAAR